MRRAVDVGPSFLDKKGHDVELAVDAGVMQRILAVCVWLCERTGVFLGEKLLDVADVSCFDGFGESHFFFFFLFSEKLRLSRMKKRDDVFVLVLVF